MKGAALLGSLLILTVAVVLLAPSSEGASDTDPLPQDIYPDADVIISEGKNGWVVVTTKVSDDPTYRTKEVRSGSSIRLVDWTDVDGSIVVVMDSGTLRDITVITVDRVVKSPKPVDVEFTMVSGEVSTLTMVSSSQSLSSSLPSSYFNAYKAIGSLEVSICGDVGTFNACDSLIAVSEMSLNVGASATVDRLYTTGSDGYFVAVDVEVTGGTIGYMTNRSAVVGTLDYHFRTGSVDYLSLGADTEGGSGYYLSNMWTFYVMRDFSVSIDDAFGIKRVIVGGGIIDPPSILCNGEEPEVILSRNITLDVRNHQLDLESCFIVSEDRALRLGGYSLGSSVSNAEIRETYYQTYQRLPIYGDEGIWSGFGGAVVLGGTNLYSSSNIYVPNNSDLIVDVGGHLVNSGDIMLVGNLLIDGRVYNSGIIEKQSGGSIEGEVSGDGYIASCIFARPNEGMINIMTVEDSAIVIRSTSGDIEFQSATMRFNDAGAKIIVVSGDTPIVNSMLLAAISVTDGEDREKTWRIHLEGFGTDYGILVTMSVSIPSGYVPIITDSMGDTVEVSEYSYNYVTFVADGSGEYAFNAMPESEVNKFELGVKGNAIIASAIVIIAAVAVYMLLRRD